MARRKSKRHSGDPSPASDEVLEHALRTRRDAYQHRASFHLGDRALPILATLSSDIFGFDRHLDACRCLAGDDATVSAVFATPSFRPRLVAPEALARLYERLADSLPRVAAAEAIGIAERCGCLENVPVLETFQAPLGGRALARVEAARVTAAQPRLDAAVARLRRAVLHDVRVPNHLRTQAGNGLLADELDSAPLIIGVDEADPTVLFPALVWRALVAVVDGKRGPSRDRAGRLALAHRVVATTSSSRLRPHPAGWPRTLHLLSEDDARTVALALVDRCKEVGHFASLLLASPQGRLALLARLEMMPASMQAELFAVLSQDEVLEIVVDRWATDERIRGAMLSMPRAFLADERLITLALSTFSVHPWHSARLLVLGGAQAQRELLAIVEATLVAGEVEVAVPLAVQLSDCDAVDVVPPLEQALALALAARLPVLPVVHAMERRGDARCLAVLEDAARACPEADRVAVERAIAAVSKRS